MAHTTKPLAKALYQAFTFVKPQGHLAEVSVYHRQRVSALIQCRASVFVVYRASGSRSRYARPCA